MPRRSKPGAVPCPAPSAATARVPPSKGAWLCALFIAVPAAGAVHPGAQQDTLRVTPLDTLVVSIERVPRPLALSNGSITRLTRTELRATTARTLAGAIALIPGVVLVDRDGMGDDPQLMMRGFYGGGEAEYALLLVDGRPVNLPESGRIDWDLVPLSSVASVEVVRGGVSAAWGDAAMGGVIHVRTLPDTTGRRLSLSGGGLGTGRASLAFASSMFGRPATFDANWNRTDGFREHARRTAKGVRANGRLIEREGAALSWWTAHAWREFDEPGPLTAADLAAGRTQAAPFYRFDHASERTHRGGLDGERRIGASRGSAFISIERRRADRIRTLPLAPTFADTQERALRSWRLAGSAQLVMPELPWPGDDDLVLGVDVSLGWLTSSYYDFLRGPPAAYAGADPARGERNQHGSGSRVTAAGYFGYGVSPTPAVRLSAGGRLDWLRDSFDDEGGASRPGESTAHVVFSPRAGINVRIVDSARQRAHLHLGASRSFKAPTPDQLYDQRRIPIPFPPFETAFSNAELMPQFGTNVEVGLVHDAELVPNHLSAGLTLSVWQMRLRDELDFSVETFRYENIGRSRHRGLDVGARLRGPGTLTTFANYTRQSALARSGEHAGNVLKAIPLHAYVAGVQTGDAHGLATGLTWTHAARMYLDDANTRRVPAWSRWDATAAWAIPGSRVFATVSNLFDATYSTTGFPDPAGTGITWWYPAAGRRWEFGVDFIW